ncbi:MAG TPA: ABC transporter substrate-binding protein [Candidatus Acidoferrales bacterium]|nr:ABC transporter substrate-binding protein [Candidatus Acidoferrales bacterium]
MQRFSLRRFVTFAVLATMITAVVGPATAADDTVDLPTFLSVTGGAAFIGKEALESVQLWADIVNAQGGIRGKKVHVVLQDTTSTPAVAVQLMNQAISNHVQATFGPTFTAECNALAPLIANGPLVSCYSPGVHPPAGSFMFSGGVGSDSMAVAITNYFRARGWTHIAIINSTDASGQDFADNFDKAMALPVNSGLQLVAHEHFATTDLSVQAQIARIKSANPQTVIVWTAGTGLGVALQGVHDVGLDVPIMAGNGNMVRQQLDGYAAFLPKTLLFPGILGITPLATSAAGIKAAEAQFTAAYAKAGMKPDLPGALSWDPTRLLLDAYAALGWNATSDQLRAWIVSQHAWAGINGIYDFAKYPQRGIGVDSCVITLWNPTTHDFTPASGPGGTTPR